MFTKTQLYPNVLKAVLRMLLVTTVILNHYSAKARVISLNS